MNNFVNKFLAKKRHISLDVRGKAGKFGDTRKELDLIVFFWGPGWCFVQVNFWHPRQRTR
ncbi:MAG: hypothetical protein ABSF38_01705 [Verrucomicrobiota bacterium]